MGHLSDSKLRSQVFCISPLAKSRYGQILEKFEDPFFALVPSSEIPLGKNWIIEGRKSRTKMTLEQVVRQDEKTATHIAKHVKDEIDKLKSSGPNVSMRPRS